MYLLGIDIGSSSIKASVIDGSSGAEIGSASSPDNELEISAPQIGWAEQDPDTWWRHVRAVTLMLADQLGSKMKDVAAIGISYQMHGLVLVDENHEVLRPAIIWCDSRAVDIGDQAFKGIGPERCLTHLLNSPGNFTASKLKWVQQNEPEIFAKIKKMILPGDYIAMRMTGAISTTHTGLSEAIMWDYVEDDIAAILLDYYKFDPEILPDSTGSFDVQGELGRRSAEALGLTPGIPVSYRAGDQPNNALSLNVLQPGEMAASGGTSGVIYGISGAPIYDPESRVNTFIHVNHTQEIPSYGVLLCVNGTGRLYSWVKHEMVGNTTYLQLNEMAATAPVGADKLVILPYGNGAERSLKNRDIGSSFHNLDLNRHSSAHISRAAQEGIAFALNYGVEIVRGMGMAVDSVRASHSGMFLSPIFCEAFSNSTGASLEIYDTDGAAGAAIGAGIGANYFGSAQDAFSDFKPLAVVEPDPTLQSQYGDAYSRWNAVLESTLMHAS